MIEHTSTWRQELVRLLIALGMVAFAVSIAFAINRIKPRHSDLGGGILLVTEFAVISLGIVWFVWGDGWVVLRLPPVLLAIYGMYATINFFIVAGLIFFAEVFAGLLLFQGVCWLWHKRRGIATYPINQYSLRQLLELMTCLAMLIAFANVFRDQFAKVELIRITAICAPVAWMALLGIWLGLVVINRVRLFVWFAVCIVSAIACWRFLAWMVELFRDSEWWMAIFIFWVQSAIVAAGILLYRWLSRKRLVERWIARGVAVEATPQNGSRD